MISPFSIPNRPYNGCWQLSSRSFWVKPLAILLSLTNDAIISFRVPVSSQNNRCKGFSIFTRHSAVIKVTFVWKQAFLFHFCPFKHLYRIHVRHHCYITLKLHPGAGMAICSSNLLTPVDQFGVTKGNLSSSSTQVLVPDTAYNRFWLVPRDSFRYIYFQDIGIWVRPFHHSPGNLCLCRAWMIRVKGGNWTAFCFQVPV